MSQATQNLRNHASEALSVLDLVQSVGSDLQIVSDERTATALPLVLASWNTAETIYALLINQPERSWVSALALHRAQMEHLIRAAFFAKAASQREVLRFRNKGKMPTRGRRAVYISELVEVVSDHMSWDQKKMRAFVKSHYKELSSLIHGGRELLGIYTMNEHWGDLTYEWDELIPTVDNVQVLVMLAMGVAMSLSPLEPDALDRAVRLPYEAAQEFFRKSQVSYFNE